MIGVCCVESPIISGVVASIPFLSILLCPRLSCHPLESCYGAFGVVLKLFQRLERSEVAGVEVLRVRPFLVY